MRAGPEDPGRLVANFNNLQLRTAVFSSWLPGLVPKTPGPHQQHGNIARGEESTILNNRRYS
jgi:hypothetical protein